MISTSLISTLKLIGFSFKGTIVSFLIWIDSMLYSVFHFFFTIFIKLAQHQFFKIDAFDAIFHNLYLIFGIVALFLVAYSLLQVIINPDNQNGGAKNIRDMIVRFILSMVLISFLPTIFTFLRDFQNSIIEYNVVPRTLIGAVKSGDVKLAIIKAKSGETDDNSTPEADIEYIDSKDVDLTTIALDAQVSDMILQVVMGTMYPLDNGKAIVPIYGDDNIPRFYITNPENGCNYVDPTDSNGINNWCADISDYWTTDKKVWSAVAGAGIGIGIIIVASIAAAIITGGASLAVEGVATLAGLGILGAGAIGAVDGYVVATILQNADSQTYTWTAALLEVEMGNYNILTAFSDSVASGAFHYTPIITTIAIGFMTYMMISFCFDLVIRQAKLVFYQLFAPVCFLVSVIPSKRDLLKNWFKAVLTTWLEVFIRLATVCILVLFISKIDFLNITNFFGHPIVSTFIILGLVLFAKQIPKLFKDLTGIDSGNMKLNLREKLADSGALAAGALIGGGLTTGIRNTVNAGKNSINKFRDIKGKTGKERKKAAWSAVGSVVKGIGSVAAGTTSGGLRSLKAGVKAKNAKDMITASAAGAKAAVDKRIRRANYKASHLIDGEKYGAQGLASVGNAVGLGSIYGHIKDTVISAGRWAGFNNVEEYKSAIASMSDVNSSISSVGDEARKVIESNASTGKTFTYGLSGVKNGATGLEYSLNNVRAFQDAIKNAQANGDGLAEFTLYDEKRKEMVSDYYSLADLQRKYDAYMADYSDELTNQAFLSAENYKVLIDNTTDYREVGALDGLRSKADIARGKMYRALGSEAVATANAAAIDTLRKELMKSGMSESQAIAMARDTAEKEALLLNASSINGDLRVNKRNDHRTALNLYGAANKNVTAKYNREIAKIEQQEKDKKGE